MILDWILEEPRNRETSSIFKENMIKLRTKRDYEQLDAYSLLARTYGFSLIPTTGISFSIFIVRSG